MIQILFVISQCRRIAGNVRTTRERIDNQRDNIRVGGVGLSSGPNTSHFLFQGGCDFDFT